MPGFPDGMRRILFDPENQFAGKPCARASTAARHGRISRRISPVAELASPADQKLLALADRLVGSAGRGRANALSRLAGGKNNQVYRVATDAGDAVVLKRYFSDPRDPRDRLAAEWGFLQHTWSRGVRAVPSRWPAMPPHGPASMGLCRAGSSSPPNSSRSTSMPRSISSSPSMPRPARPQALAPASEACFSLADHIATVERRVARLGDPRSRCAACAAGATPCGRPRCCRNGTR